MERRRQLRIITVMVFAIAATLPAALAEAGLKDRLKKKVEEKAGQKTDEAADKAMGSAEGAVAGGKGEAGTAGEGDAAESADTGTGSGVSTKVSEVSTKFDFVPGDKVLFADDFTQDELGEFPTRWSLSSGTFEVAEMAGERWLRCTSVEGAVRMKLGAGATLPEFWTLEFDAYCGQPSGNVFTVVALSGNQEVWNAVFPYSGRSLAFGTGDVFSDTPVDEAQIWGKRHHLQFMARGGAMKVYVGQQRVANVPEIDTAHGAPTSLDFRLWSSEQPMITNVRFAEGPKPAKDLLAEGKLVTYGIHFASGSDVVKPESAPVLRQIAAYLESNAAVKLRITGHTDNTGTSAGNLDLSQRRAASVARILSDEFKLAADRFTTDGRGDADAVATNDTAEGRAMNRRVEFTKL